MSSPTISHEPSPLSAPTSVFQTFYTFEYAERPNAALRLGSSVFIHAAILALIVVVSYLNIASLPSQIEEDDRILTMARTYTPSMNIPGPVRGGGGGGGGKREKTPASKGDIPPAVKVQTAPPQIAKPDLTKLQLALPQNVQSPIQYPKHMLGAYGDIAAPPAPASSGAGAGGGIGAGSGTGVGPGRGPGIGPGSGGGFGGGSGGGVGSGEGPYVGGTAGVTNPMLIRQTTPHYTDEAIKAKVQGIVVLQAVIRKDGSVDQPRVVRSLGYGLDEEAIRTVMNEWKFRPGSLNGRPVDVFATIEISFNLR